MGKKSKDNNYIASDFYCTQCGTKNIPVYRTKGREREAGHLKKLYCHTCGKEQNCVEIKQNNKNYTYLDFIIEFEYDNFNKDGTRKKSYGRLRNDIHNGHAERKKVIRDGGNTWLW